MRLHGLIIFPLSLCLTFGLLGCKDKGGDKSKDDAFKPGDLVEKTVGGGIIKIKVPNNLEQKELDTDDGGWSFSAKGFPTITVVMTEAKGFGRSFSSGTNRVRVRLRGATATFTCEALEPGDFKDLLETVCKSMAPQTGGPQIYGPDCKVENMPSAGAVGAIEPHNKAIQACFEAGATDDKDFVGASWSLTFGKTGASSSASHSTGLQAANDCLKGLFDKIKEDMQFKRDEDFSASCTVKYARF